MTVTSFAYSTRFVSFERGGTPELTWFGSVTTSSTETTATTFSTYTFGPNVQKRDLEPKSNPFEPGPTPGALLGVIPSIISAACSCALNLRTTTVKTISTTSTTTVASTIQLTSVSTATVPTTTVTIFSTIVIPYDTTITPVVSTTLPSTIITTSTTTAVATTFVCPLQSEIDGGGIGVGNSGQLNEITGVSTSLSCCEACYSTAGCGLWLYFDDFGYFTGVNAIRPNVNTMCPTGYGAYITISSGGVSGDFGGPGPCAGSISAD